MNIESVDFFYLSMPEVLDIGDGSQDMLLVRVTGAGGYVGWGECEAAPLVSIASLVCPMSHSACKPVAASVVGQRLDEPADIERIGNLVRANSLDLLQADHTLSGIDMAMWDLLGRRRGEPVYKLLGYDRAYAKTPYASLLFADEPQRTLLAARELRRRGFRAVKFGWGPFGRGTVKADEEHLAAAREGLGTDGILLVDAGTVWTGNFDAARQRLDALKRHRATWLEEPFVSGELEAYLKLATMAGDVRLAGGEGCHNVHMARHMIDYAGMGYVQIDAGRIGGITSAKQVADYAKAKGVTYVNHTFTSHLALSASIQPFAGIESDVICEYPVEPKPLAYEATREHLLTGDDGQIRLPDSPGLGVTPDVSALQKYLVDVEIAVGGKTLYPDARALTLTHVETEQPTRVRYGVLFFLCTLALLLYVDRVCIGQAASHIQLELGLTKTQMSWAFTVFSLAYALFEVPAGHWGDKYGSRGVITRVVVFWSLFTALTGAALGLYSLLIIRFLFGAGEAGALPNVARVIPRWFPVHNRGKVRGTVMLVSMTGAAVAPILSAHLIEAVGWRMTFVVFGAAGVLWAVAFYAWFRDDPATHPRTNAAELALIGPPENVPTADGETHVSIPWRTVLLSPNVWLLGLIMTVSGLLFYMLFQWYPTYLKEARGQGELASGWLTSIVMAAGAIGCLFGGWLSDVVLRHSSDRKRARSLCGAALLALASVSALSAARFAESAVAITACNALALFFMQSAVPTWWSVVAEISGRHGGAMWGLMNSMASLGLMALNLFAGRLVDHRQSAGYTPAQSWTPVFDAVAVGLLLGAFAWLAVDATRSVVTPQDPAPSLPT